MKDYKDMAAAVFRRRDAYEKKRQKQRKTIKHIAITGSVCVILCFLTTLLLEKEYLSAQQPESLTSEQLQEGTTAETAPTVLEESSQNCLLFLASDNGTEIAETELHANISLPFGYTVTVTDLRGMSEEDARTLYHRLNQELSNKLTPDTFSSAGITRGANMALTVTQTGCFILEIADRSSVSSIKAECVSEFGEVQFYILKDNQLASNWHPHWNELTISGEEYAAFDPDTQLAIAWHHSMQMVDALDKNPDIPLSNFSDQLIITVNHKDGTAETFISDIQFSDEGIAVIEHKGSVYYSAESNM